MRQSCHIKALCLILVLYLKGRDGGGAGCLAGVANSQFPPHSWSFFADKIAKFPGYEGLNHPGSSGISKDEISGIRRLIDVGWEKTNRKPLLGNFNESQSSLQNLATRVMEIIDRISRNWAVEGAKTIQNGEIGLRKLYRDFSDKVAELLANGSEHGQHTLDCVNQTIFQADLDRILGETTNCYSKSLEAIQRQLIEVEEQEKALLQKMGNCARKIFDMLSECFVRDSSPDIIGCLQKVDGINIGREMRVGETLQLVAEVSGAVSDIPKAFSECTTKGLAETEAHIRRGYAVTLACLKGN